MKRDIKFRIFNPHGKNMLYDIDNVYECLKQQIKHDNIMPDRGFVTAYDHESEGMVFMQFTGLTDKKGKDIYENDIITWKETRFHTQEHQNNGVPMPKIYKSVVVWEDGGFVVSSNQENDTPLCCFFNDSVDNKFDYKAEIIGNIHETPELL